MKKNRIFFKIIVASLLFNPASLFAQAPDMRSTVDFVIFSTSGAVTNTGITHLRGNVGTNSGSSTGFGNVDGQMHDGGLVSTQCAADLLLVYNDLSATVATMFPAPLLGNGQVLTPGVHSIASAASLNLDLTLDAQGDPNAVFIIQINGGFSTGAASEVKLINGALACNVFWNIEGLVSMAAGTSMKGNVIAHNAAINLNAGATLEGRALAINGAISVNSISGKTPIGCGSATLTGPLAPDLASIACYALFSADGEVTNSGITTITGDVGTNLGLTTGYDPLLVTGTIHSIPDASTLACASDLTDVYSYLNGLSTDINLLYPAQFGNSLELTPHIYLLSGATSFTDTLILNAMGNPNAVFVIKINGALSTSVNSYVKLMNGAQAKNVYWKVDGAVTINGSSTFRGTLICNNGAISLQTGVKLDGRALTTTGAVTTFAISTNNGPSITVQPVNATGVCNDYNTSFSLTAENASTYQWQLSTNGGVSWINLSNGGLYSGTKSPNLNLTNVTASDNYKRYRCKVTGACSGSVFSDVVMLTLATAVVIPANLVETRISLTEATLSWDSLVASDMRIAIRKVGTTQWHIQQETYADSIVLAGLFDKDTTYEWRVKVQEGGCWGDWSAIKSFYVCGTPDAPTDLVSSEVYTNKVTLAWTSRGAYEVRIGVKRVGTTVWHYQHSEYADSYVYNADFSDNSTYEWKIKIKCGTRWGDWSEIGEFTTGEEAGISVNPNSSQKKGLLATEDFFIQTYPNPNNGTFTMNASHEGTFTIVNQLGQVIQTLEITKENNFETAITGLNHGIYFVTGTLNGEMMTNKIVVQ